MKRLFAKIKKEALSKDEKLTILSSLRDFVDQNPIRSVKSPFYSEWFAFRYRTIVAPVAIILVFALTGGTVFAAKNSLPGDMLYPIKMLREKVESLAAPNSKARAQVEVSHAIIRLQEVEQIITSKKPLEKGAGQEISDNFGTQIKDMASNIDELKSSGQMEDAAKIESDFHKSLSEHEQTIQKILTDTNIQTQTKEELSHVYYNIHSQLEKTQSLEDDGQKDQNTQDEQDQDRGEVKGAETKNQTEANKNTKAYNSENNEKDDRPEPENKNN